jgi:hypothetical protein
LNSDLDILDSIFTSATTRPISSIIKSGTKLVDATTTSRAILLSLTSISNATTRTWTAQNTSGTVAFTSNIATATTGMTTTGMLAAATVGMVDTSSAQIISNKGFATSTTATASQATTSTTLLASVGYVDRVAIQQYVISSESAEEDHATTIPYDDTIPQSGEGSEYLSVSITPKSATSKLLIEVQFNCTITDVTQFAIVALFQDATANALKAVGAGFVSAGGSVSMETISFTYEMTSGTTSATTFKVRAGTGGGTQLTMNGGGGSRLFGGVCRSHISVTEIGV